MSSIIQALPFYLNQPISGADVSIQVKGLKDSRGNLITAMPSGVANIYVTIEPQSVNSQEIISFTGITDNGNGVVTLTGVTRNLNPVSPFTAGTANISHANNATCVISNNPQVFQDVVMTNEARTVTSVVTFSASPVVPTATNAGDAINKSQLDLAVLGTVPPSSTTVLGAVRVATDPTKTLGTATMTIASPCVVTFNAHGLTANDTVRFTTSGALPTGLVVGTTYYVIATGLTVNTFQLSATAGGSAINTSGGQSGTHTLYRTTPYAVNDQDTRLLKFATDAGASDAYAITISPVPTSYTNGMFITFRANTANTGASTLNVNGLGAKNIVKSFNQTLADNDIKVNQIVTVVYESTTDTFQMVSQLGNLPTQSVDVQTFSTPGTTSWTKPTGAKWVEVILMGGGGAGGSGTGANNSSGGAGGGYSRKTFLASSLGVTETVVVGSAGVAGANNTAGGAGGFSAFGTTVLLRAEGGNGGAGSATISGGASNGDIRYPGGNSGSTFTSPGVSTATDPSPRAGGNGGYNGGTPTTATAGGAGGGFITAYVKAGGAGGAAGVNAGTAGTTTDAGLLFGGVGGGGGGFNGSGTNTGGNGGAGGFPGGGGGGSVGTNNVGGNGAVGVVVITTYF